MAKCETVLVKHPDIQGETMVINKSDYDENPTRYTIAKAPRKAKAAEDESEKKTEGGEGTEG